MSRRREAGFTLLEAIVALAVLAAALLPFYLTVSGAGHAVRRADRANRLAEVELDALNVMAAVNPMRTPSGSVELGPYRVQWSSQIATEPLEAAGYPNGRGLYRVGLFDARVAVVDGSNRELVKFPLQMVGFDKALSK